MGDEQTATVGTEEEEVQNHQGHDEQEQEEVETVEMTKEEYEAELQKEADRRVTQAIKKREQEFKKELEKEKEEARKEAEELAKLSQEERSKVEKEREEMKLSKEREKLESERKEFENEKLKLQAEKELSVRGLPAEFAPYIYGTDAEDTLERITVFEEKWQDALQKGIEEKLKSKAPRIGVGKNNRFTKSQLESMTPDEINANWEQISRQMEEGKI